jgi:hypothetical protein
MKNFLYKLIFPECGKLYFGRAAHDSRYPGNKPNERFVGPHHNKEVQNLLDAGEFCFFSVVKEFKTTEELSLAEETYLKKVWKTDNWTDRPQWLLNRNRNSVGWASGNLHPNKKPEAKERLRKQALGNSYGAANRGRTNHWMRGEKNPVHNLSREQLLKNAERLRTPEAKQKAKETRERNKLDPGYTHGNKGRKRPDLAGKKQTEKQKSAARAAQLKTKPCPNCGKELNPGNLSKHIRSRICFRLKPE